MKEDIVLDSYTGTHSFTFLLDTNGMRLYNNGGQYYLATSANAEEKLFLGDVLVYDAKGEPSLGTLTVGTITMGQQYRLTVSADPEFLTDPDTVYPVTIDPSLTISDNQEAGAIEDASVYELIPTLNTGTWPYAHCGYYSSAYGVGRTAYRLTGLIDDTQWQTIDPSNIVEAKLYVREASGTAAAAVNLYALTNSAWTETGVTWNTLVGYDSTVLATASPTYNAWGVWDITGLAKAWKNGTRSIQAGFVLMNANESSNCKSFYTSEHSTTASRPYFTITYNNAVVEVEEGKSITLNAAGITGTITWLSADEKIATVNPTTGVVTGVHAGETEITAYVDGIVQATFPVRVVLKDDIYWITDPNLNYFLTSDDGTLQNGTPVELHTAYTTMPNKLLQMWKVTHLGDGNYSIRPMHKLNMGLDNTNGDIDLWTIGETDTSNTVPDYAVWKVFYKDTGYILQSGDITEFAIKRPTNEANDVRVTGEPYSPTDTSFRWVVATATSPGSGIVFYDTNTHSLCTTPSTRHIEMGQSETLADMGLIVSVYSPYTNSQLLAWQVTDASVLSVGYHTGTLTGSSRCDTTVTVKPVNETIYSVMYNVSIEETIYIDNYYDTTIQSQQIINNNIAEAVEFLNTVYRDEFNLHFVMSGAPQLYVDPFFDECQYGTADPCLWEAPPSGCGTDCASHHKNVFRIADGMLVGWQPNHIVVKWSNFNDNIYCSGISKNQHITKHCYALVTYKSTDAGELPQPAVQVLTIKGWGTQELGAYMCVNLAHEVAHVLGMNDAYDEESYGKEIAEAHVLFSNSDNKGREYCIMSLIELGVYGGVANKGEDALCHYCTDILHGVIADDVLTALP